MSCGFASSYPIGVVTALPRKSSRALALSIRNWMRFFRSQRGEHPRAYGIGVK
jgi:hypothetical protein